MKRFFAFPVGEPGAEDCAKAYKNLRAHVTRDELIDQLMKAGCTSNLESYHGSLYHKHLLNKNSNPQVKSEYKIITKSI